MALPRLWLRSDHSRSPRRSGPFGFRSRRVPSSDGLTCPLASRSGAGITSRAWNGTPGARAGHGIGWYGPIRSRAINGLPCTPEAIRTRSGSRSISTGLYSKLTTTCSASRLTASFTPHGERQTLTAGPDAPRRVRPYTALGACFRIGRWFLVGIRWNVGRLGRYLAEVCELHSAPRPHTGPLITEPVAGAGQLPAHDIERGVGAEPLHKAHQPVSSSTARAQTTPQADHDPREVGERRREAHHPLAALERTGNI